MARSPWGALCAAFLALTGGAAHGWERFDSPAPGAPESIGGYSAGCVIGAEALPIDGTGYQAVRLSRNRHHGHPQLVRFIEEFAERAALAELGTVVVGDMGQPRGGPMPADHASHQAGLDVDIYFRLDLPRLPPEQREDPELRSVVDPAGQRVNERFGDAQAELVRLAASDPRVARIFVNPPIKQALCEREWDDRDFLHTVRPWFGHTRHMHVRLHCPSDSPDCRPQPQQPRGDGCGEELASWLEEPALEWSPGRAAPPELPARCEALR